MKTTIGPFTFGAPELATHGLRVFPLTERAKKPAICRWQQRATADCARVIRLAAKHGTDNVGVATGGSIVVVDLDVKAGHDGFAALKCLEREHGTLPATLTALTPTSGAHLYFRVPFGSDLRNSASKLAQGIDVRGKGGFVVAPPSIHPNGGAYAWRDGNGPGQVPIAPLPVAWLHLIQQTSQARAPAPTRALPAGPTSRYGAVALAAEAAKVAATPVGGRNNALVRGAFKTGQLVGAGHVDEATAFAALDSAGALAGLDKEERHATLQSGLKAGKRYPRAIAQGRAACQIPALTVATLEAVQPTWRRGLRLRKAEEGYIVVDADGKVLTGLDMPMLGLDADLVACLGRGVGKLSSVVGFRVLQWEVRRAHEQWLAGVREYHRLEVERGWSGLAEQVGAPHAADDVRDVVTAQALLRFRFAHGAQGNLLQYAEPTPAARNCRALLVLTLGDPLLHGYVAKLAAGRTGLRARRNRWLVPLLPELPRLDALPRQAQAAGVRLHWLFLRELAAQPKALAQRGGIRLSDADWLLLAADAGLRPDYLPRLLQSWQDASMCAAFLEQRDRDTWTLGPEHATAVAFIAKRLELAVQHKQRAGSGGGAQRST